MPTATATPHIPSNVRPTGSAGSAGVTRSARSTGSTGSTRSTEDLVRLYLNEIGRVPVPGPEDQVALAQRIEAGDEAARAEMLAANLRLVVHWASRYQDRGIDLLDLIQEGTFGLAHAIEKFDWRKGFRFSTYASWWIRKSLQQAVAQSATIRVPSEVGEHSRRLSRLQDELHEALGRVPTEEELEEESGLTAGEFLRARQAARVTASLDQPVGEEEDATLGGFLPSTADVETDVFNGQAARALAEALDRLPPFLRQVVTMRYGFDGEPARTVRSTARALGIGDRKVRAAEAEALDLLRAADVVAALDDRAA